MRWTGVATGVAESLPPRGGEEQQDESRAERGVADATVCLVHKNPPLSGQDPVLGSGMDSGRVSHVENGNKPSQRGVDTRSLSSTPPVWIHS